MVKRAVLIYLIGIYLIALPLRAAQAGRSSPCSVVERALKDAQGLKAGMVRKDVEAHNFVMAGGMVARDRTIYVYKDCDYINLEIDFSPDPAVDRDFSPRDVITSVSKLTLDYPVKD